MSISDSLNQSVVYPTGVDRGAQVTISANLLRQVQATGKTTYVISKCMKICIPGAVFIIMENMDDILPKPDK